MEDEIILVVEGQQILAQKSSIALSGELWLVLLQSGPGLVVSVHDSVGPQDSRRLPHWQEVQQL